MNPYNNKYCGRLETKHEYYAVAITNGEYTKNFTVHAHTALEARTAGEKLAVEHGGRWYISGEVEGI